MLIYNLLTCIQILLDTDLSFDNYVDVINWIIFCNYDFATMRPNNFALLYNMLDDFRIA